MCFTKFEAIFTLIKYLFKCGSSMEANMISFVAAIISVFGGKCVCVCEEQWAPPRKELENVLNKSLPIFIFMNWKSCVHLQALSTCGVCSIFRFSHIQYSARAVSQF